MASRFCMVIDLSGTLSIVSLMMVIMAVMMMIIMIMMMKMNKAITWTFLKD